MLNFCRKKCFLFVFAHIVVCFFPYFPVINGRSRESFNEAWHCVINSVVCVTTFFQRFIFDYLFIWLTVK